MAIADIRRELESARKQLAAGQTEEALDLIDRVLENLDGARLLTTTQAREWLGLGSVNTLKLLVRKAKLDVVMHGNRMMIPVAELERLQDSPVVRGLWASDRLHRESADLGGPEGLSEEELQDLSESRPGVLPWKKTQSPTAE